MKSVTWNKDSHGLFDYESKNCVNAKFKFKAGDYSILRNKQSRNSIMQHQRSLQCPQMR